MRIDRRVASTWVELMPLDGRNSTHGLAGQRSRATFLNQRRDCSSWQRSAAFIIRVDYGDDTYSENLVSLMLRTDGNALKGATEPAHCGG